MIIIFSILIVFSTIQMLAKSTHVLLEGVPEVRNDHEIMIYHVINRPTAADRP
jgi:Co/Zn/Cd efflux system component